MCECTCMGMCMSQLTSEGQTIIKNTTKSFCKEKEYFLKVQVARECHKELERG